MHVSTRSLHIVRVVYGFKKKAYTNTLVTIYLTVLISFHVKLIIHYCQNLTKLSREL